ncbi:MAG: NAD-dependent succinate-semialdehyde dehydrogenase [Desulfobacterales bacterium]|nr:NAD-dependent succinate-semialdehyde dehydrogenase [Desulfobacterales bacterium]
MYSEYGLFIDGKWQNASDKKTFPVINPATEEIIGEVPSATPEDLEHALESARKGFDTWKRTPAWDRAVVLRKASVLIHERIEEIARVMVTETGKPLAEARGETAAAADQFEWYAEETKRIYGQTIEGRTPDVRMSVIYQPVGVCAAFSAWNFPVLLPARKIAAALAAGCSVICKPAGEAPGTLMVLVQALADAGIPSGAVCVVTGKSSLIAEHLIGSSTVRKVSLTGSVPVGKQLLHLCADGVKKVSMELGGHGPAIVFDDADPLAAAKTLATAKFRNCGQVCISPSRFYVHNSIRDVFANAFTDYAKSLTLGLGFDPGVTLGPMANQRGLEHCQALCVDAVDKGGRLLTGGKRAATFQKGYFFEPTVIDNVPEDALIMHQEPFAPIAPITGFDDFDEVMARANALPFGLAGYVFTESLKTATLASEALEVGMVGINEVLLACAEAPFGGVKESGMGREGGSMGILDYLVPKYIKTRLSF